jgi:hypothetical protein
MVEYEISVDQFLSSMKGFWIAENEDCITNE